MGSPNVDFGDLWICFNIQDTKNIVLPKTANKIVLTYHTEYIKYKNLIEFFNLHLDTQFLLLTDWINDKDGIFWPENVTYLRWITWHHQLSNIIKHYDINHEIDLPSRKISSLSFQHEFHKAAVTAYLLKTFPENDMILSWWNVKSSKDRLYYLDPEYFLPQSIANHLLDKNFQDIKSIELDKFINSPMINSNWSHPAFLDCLFNCTNESIYNDVCLIEDRLYRLPYPYLTEKTWKPLLAGRSFLPVGQSNSLRTLTQLGLKFIPELNAIDVSEREFDRMQQIWTMLDWIRNNDIKYLFDYTFDDVSHNVSWIYDGYFASECEKQNRSLQEKIQQWI